MQAQQQTALIIGCGIAGPALALALQRVGISAAIYEAQETIDDSKGVFLGITPNGLHVLSQFISLDELAADHTSGNIRFYNAKNKWIGTIDTAYQQKKFGAATVQVKRAALNKALRVAALQKGILLHTGKKLAAINQTNQKVTASFTDGSVAEADLLFGCDGIHSATRKIIFPDAAPMKYTDLLSGGGYSRFDNNLPADAIHMTFGKKAFFAWAVSNRNELWWFNNIASEKEPGRSEISSAEMEALKNKLLQLHAGDPYPVEQCIRSAHHIELYPVYEIPFLQQWYTGRVCLLGDAAHATSPHIGQGASLALEDVVVLSNCLRDNAGVTNAFQQFQQKRKERVELIVKQARKIGDVKAVPNRVQRFFRDLLLRVFVKKEIKKMDWVYAYKADQV